MNTPAKRTSVSHLMSRDVITTRRDAALAPVVEMMMRRGLGEVAVVDQENALLGVVTRGDLLNPVVQGDSPEEFIARRQSRGEVIAELDDGFHLDVGASVTVGDVMRKAAISIGEQASAKDAAKLMAAHRLQALTVVSAVGAVIGTLNAVDLVHLLH